MTPKSQLRRLAIQKEGRMSAVWAPRWKREAKRLRAELDALQKKYDDIAESRLGAYALAEETWCDMEGLKMGVRKFAESIKTNICDSTFFPENMRMMATMLIGNSGVLQIEEPKEFPLKEGLLLPESATP